MNQIFVALDKAGLIDHDILKRKRTIERENNRKRSEALKQRSYRRSLLHKLEKLFLLSGNPWSRNLKEFYYAQDVEYIEAQIKALEKTS